MSELHLDLFMSAGRDVERVQYEVLAGLQRIRRAFSQNIIYPHLAHLIDLYKTLGTVAERLAAMRDALPGRVSGIDLAEQTVIYEKTSAGGGDVEAVEELINWALPRIRSAIEEGRTIYEFVEDHLHMQEVGIVPAYTQEGYLFVPDAESGQLHVLLYTLSVFRGADERYRTLKTTHVKSVAFKGVHRSPHSVKLDLLAEHRDLPNPATYFFSTDIEFPYAQTTLPIVKRRLMRHLFQAGGQA